MNSTIVNAFTVDLEDWYQVANLDQLIGFDSWAKCEDRLEGSTERLLALLRAANVHATFYVLAWNCGRHAELIRRIAAEGHEIGTHGYSHSLIYRQEPAQFADELRRSVDILTGITGRRVQGHRAASFSITARSRWALRVLADCGITYDSSILPVRHPRYGISDAPRLPHMLIACGRSVAEFPVSTTRCLGANIPFSGGAYFRFLPYTFVLRCIRHHNSLGIPVMFYVHPWELDPGQPRMPLGPAAKLRCYHNIENTESRLRRLLADCLFGTAIDALLNIGMETLPCVETEY